MGEEAHLTVAVVDYEIDGERRFGAASGHLAGLTGEEATVRVFVEQNPRFRLPANPTRDVIMIGPGTGVAPYRGFLQQREAQGSTGRNWLVFGARHFDSEFLYQIEWQEAFRKGLLQRIDLAFSRDDTPRAYVQDRLREAGPEIFAWLEGGASLYVCGDAEQMAPDVHAALLDVVAEQFDAAGGRRDQAGQRLQQRRLSGARRPAQQPVLAAAHRQVERRGVAEGRQDEPGRGDDHLGERGRGGHVRISENSAVITMQARKECTKAGDRWRWTSTAERDLRPK